MDKHIFHRYSPEELEHFKQLNPNFTNRYGEPWKILRAATKLYIFLIQEGSRNHMIEFDINDSEIKLF